MTNRQLIEKLIAMPLDSQIVIKYDSYHVKYSVPLSDDEVKFEAVLDQFKDVVAITFAE